MAAPVVNALLICGGKYHDMDFARVLAWAAPGLDNCAASDESRAAGGIGSDFLSCWKTLIARWLHDPHAVILRPLTLR